jgi:hypothetical protein
MRNRQLQKIHLDELRSVISSSQVPEVKDQLNGDDHEHIPLLEVSTLLSTFNRDISYHLQLGVMPQEGSGLAASNGKTNGTKASDTSLQPKSYSLRLHILRDIDNRAIELSEPSIAHPTSESIALNSQSLSISNQGRITLGSFEADLRFRDSIATISSLAQDLTIYPRILESFQAASHPLELPVSKHFMKSFAERDDSLKLGIFARTNSILTDEPASDAVEKFIPLGAQTVQPNIHIYQFSRLLGPGRVVDNRRLEARSFEVYLTCFDERYGKITWMTHTWTGGAIAEAEQSVPACAWALHPTQPLLVWALPGHKLRASCIKSHSMPVNLTGTRSFEVFSFWT